MSNPVNPLDRFRSYSYHHILLVTNSTEAIRLLTNPSLSDGEEQEILSTIKLGERIPVKGSENSGYYMICDTRKNSFFPITDVNYTGTLQSGNSKNTSAIASSISINMVDPLGTAFLNYIKWVTDDELKISLHKAVFLLKTIFVGHTHDGTTETVYQNGIPMMLYDMTLNPSSHGSVIYCKFSPLTCGAVTYIEDYSKVFDIPGINSKTSRLKDAIKDFENSLNSRSRKWYRDLQLTIINGTENKETTPSQGYGKLLQYMITIPDDWESFKVIGGYETASEAQFKKGGTKDPIETKGVHIGLHLNPKSTISEVLDLVLKQSDEVQALASNEAREAGNLKSYKILTSITSDDDTVVVHYDIVNFAIPKVEQDSGKTEGKDSVDKKVPFEIGPNNQIVFDYIFTGKNTDILDFQMKINNVNLFLADNIAIADKAAVEVNKDQTDKPNDEAKTAKKQVLIKLKEKDTVLPPVKTLSQHQNMPWVTETDQRSTSVKARQQFINNMSMAHGVSSFNVILKIRGNPDLYHRFSEATVPPHVKIIDNIKDVKYITTDEKFVKGTNDQFLSDNDVKEYMKYRDERVKEIGTELTNQSTKTPSLLPFYVKVNIKGQDYDVLDTSENAFSSFKPFKDMWYQGYYLISKIEHRFSNGEFTQDLMIGAIPLDLYGQENSDKNKVNNPEDSEKNKKAKEAKAADNQVGS